MSIITLLLFVIPASLQTTQKPNIVLIIADDLGWNDVGYHGSNEIPTPNIDALAYSGMILHRFYTQPSCTPSRTALLTGQYPIRLGFQGRVLLSGENRYLPQNVKLLPEKLKELGYNTALIGKWHLGSSYKNVTPSYRGFDYHFGYWNGFIGYFSHFSSYENLNGLDMHENLNPSWATQHEYAAHLFTRKVREIITNHNTTRPLFLMVSHLAPHAGQRGIVYEVPDVKKNQEKFYYIVDEDRRKYAGMVDELDQSVGELIKSLAQKGMLNNTIILFLSDNGAQTVGPRHKNSGSNWPLRGVGGNSDELKIDGIDQWKELVNNHKGKREDILVNIEDVENWSAFIGRERFKLVNNSGNFNEGFYGNDGRGDENPSYNTDEVVQSATNYYLGSHLTSETIIKLRQENNIEKLMGQYDGHKCNLCLFDIINDPCETRNIADKYPDIVTELSLKLSYYWSKLHKQQTKHIDVTSNPIFFNNTWTTWLDI